MALTDTAVRQAKPAEKLYKLSDAGGLQLWVFPNGSKRWRLAYRFGGKQQLLALGVYPTITLKDARNARDAAKKLLAVGTNPSVAKRHAKFTTAVTFRLIGEELLAKKQREGKDNSTVEKDRWLLSIANGRLGDRPIEEITAAEILAVLRTVETRGKHETAARLRGVIGQVFRYAIATARAASDPTAALRGALTNAPVTHRAAVTDPIEFGGLLRAIDAYTGTPETRYALELLALTFLRPSELRCAEWTEIDLETAIWSLPASKMKGKKSPHKVPLSTRAVEILTFMKSINGGKRYVFPSVKLSNKPLNDSTLVAAIRRMGYPKEAMSAHGFRGVASSLLNEAGLFSEDAIERQLAHTEKNKVRRAYHRAEHWDERVRMMNWWSQKCAALRNGGEVVQFKMNA